MRRLRASLGWGCGALLWAPTAAAEAPATGSCESVQLTRSAPLSPRWEAALADVCHSLAALPDRDPTARLEVAPWALGDGVHVTLHLSDGRSAERDAATPDELSAIAVALVTLPPATPSAPDAPKPPASEKPAPAPSKQAGPVAPASDGIDVAFDLSALGVVRLLGAPATLGFGVVLAGDADLDHGWVVGLRARVDPVLIDVEHQGDLESVTLGGGVELARRIAVASAVAIDVGVGADVLADVPVDGKRGGKGSADATGDVRPRVFGKVWAPGRGVSFVGTLGVELSPLRLAETRRDPLPAVGVELGAGIAWGGL